VGKGQKIKNDLTPSAHSTPARLSLWREEKIFRQDRQDIQDIKKSFCLRLSAPVCACLWLIYSQRLPAYLCGGLKILRKQIKRKTTINLYLSMFYLQIYK